jgi:molybdenum cofactor guanylyltransferase
LKIKATAIILAGGSSTRMGDEDKSMLPVNGIPLILHIVRQLEGHFDEIIIGANDKEKYFFLNRPIIPDKEEGLGPLMGIISCLEASSNEINFVTACDIPVMNIEFIQKMLEDASLNKIVMPVNNDGKYEPLYAVYHKSVAEYAREIINGGSRKVIDLLKYNPHLVDFNDTDWYRNLNTKDDYLAFIKNDQS